VLWNNSKPAAVANRKRLATTPERRAQIKAWEKSPRGKEYRRRYQLEVAAQRRNGYRVTYEQYAALVLQQQGRCAICGEVETIRAQLVVDHCHATGKVRGLLCTPCNLLLGIAKDDTARLHAAAAYLEAARDG